MEDDDSKKSASSSLLEQLTQLTGQVTSGAMDLAKSAGSFTALAGDGWLKDLYLKSIEPERLEAMAEAGKLLREARELAGLTAKEMSDALGLSDTELLEEVESGEKLLPFETIFRAASIFARHDPIPFIIKFLRTYNPSLEQKLEEWGLAQWPKKLERERRFVNIYRQHDDLRALSDEEFDRVINYAESMVSLTLEIMGGEKAVYQAKQAAAEEEVKKAKPKPKRKARAKAKTTIKKPAE
ncbi:MAG: helix-turn-helix transcriptional regulator [Pseudomonadales bacterium]